MLDNRLIVINLYELSGSPEDFGQAIRALAARVEAEGDPGVLAYRFFANAEEGTARGVIEYQDPDAWIGHHEIAMGWPEMTALHSVARLSEVVFLGPLTPAIRAWIDGSVLTARIRSGNGFAGGFRRAGGRPAV